MSQERFEPTIPVFEREKTAHDLDRAATVIGWKTPLLNKNTKLNMPHYSQISLPSRYSTFNLEFISFDKRQRPQQNNSYRSKTFSLLFIVSYVYYAVLTETAEWYKLYACAEGSTAAYLNLLFRHSPETTEEEHEKHSEEKLNLAEMWRGCFRKSSPGFCRYSKPFRKRFCFRKATYTLASLNFRVQ
jgi:hypothetical protein